jgi:hypothetical protein
MDWGSVLWLILAVLGAALVAGGIVAYRGSATVGARAFGAAAVAAGLVMWAVIVLTVPVSVTSGDEHPEGQPDIITFEGR